MMSKEKQIEEMARIIADVNATLRCSIEVCRLCEFFEVDGEMCKDCISAKALYEAGYRKQSENLIAVVRCCDCKYCEVVIDSIIDEPKYFCTRIVGSIPIDPTDYCSRARMKGGAE